MSELVTRASVLLQGCPPSLVLEFNEFLPLNHQLDLPLEAVSRFCIPEVAVTSPSGPTTREEDPTTAKPYATDGGDWKSTPAGMFLQTAKNYYVHAKGLPDKYDRLLAAFKPATSAATGKSEPCGEIPSESWVVARISGNCFEEKYITFNVMDVLNDDVLLQRELRNLMPEKMWPSMDRMIKIRAAQLGL